MPSERALKSTSSLHLDAVRGLAALLVAVSHLRALFFVEYQDVLHKNAAIKFFYLLTGLGHEAVMVFFVLSGFFISSSVLRSLQAGRWQWKIYAQNRLTRLYVVLIPALLLGLLWDCAGMAMFPRAPVYAGMPTYSHIILAPVATHLSFGAWFGNLFFLQGITVPTFGSNEPLWSLSYEFWYYALFPLAVITLRRQASPCSRLACGILAFIIFKFVGAQIALYFLVWLMGAAIGTLPLTRMGSSRIFSFCSVLILCGMLLISRQHSQTQMLTDFCIALAFSALLYGILCGRDKSPSMLYRRTAQSASGVSYTLYLVHVPLLVFLNACIIKQAGLWQPDAIHCIMAGGVAGIVFVYLWAVWRVTEAQTEKVRCLLARNHLVCGMDAKKNVSRQRKEAAHQ